MKRGTLIGIITLVIATLLTLAVLLYYNWISLGTFIGIVLFITFCTGLIITLVFIAKQVKSREATTKDKPSERTQKELISMVRERMLMERYEKLVISEEIKYMNRGELMLIKGKGLIGRDKWAVIIPVKTPDKMIILKNASEESILEAGNGFVNPLVMQDERIKETTTPFGTERIQEKITRLLEKEDNEESDEL